MRYLLIIMSLKLFAQNIDGDIMKNSTTGSIGTVTINNQIYNQFSIRPEIPIGKLGIAFDLYIYFNDNGI